MRNYGSERRNRDTRYVAKMGHTFEDHKRINADHKLNGRSPYEIFRLQRKEAQKRRVEWLFTFAQWWKVWDESGKWNQRGHRSGQFVMARYGDIGPYSVENVRILTQNQNSAEAHGNSVDRVSASVVTHAPGRLTGRALTSALARAGISRKLWERLCYGETTTVDAQKAARLIQQFASSEAQ